MKIFLAGDISPTDLSEPKLISGDPRDAFGGVVDLVKGADLFIVNLECALTECDTRIRKYGPNLKASPKVAQTLKDMGVTDVGICNNHVYDFGHQGFIDTMAALDAVGLPYTGVGENEQAARKPHYMKVGEKTIALVAVCEHEYSYALHDREGCWGFDPFETMEDITIAKENSDFVIVFYHGGKEQSLYPSPRLRKACQGMVRAGADLVLCQHSHCIGVREDYRGANIVYGQGNFHFIGLPGFSEHPHWRNGLFIELDLDEEMNATYTYHALKDCGDHVDLCNEEENAKVVGEFLARTDTLLDYDAWMAEWNAFCEGMRAQYYNAVSIAFREGECDGQTPHQLFPHYLDCEAHTDVWRQLYPTWNGDNTLE